MTYLLQNINTPIEEFFGRPFQVIAAGLVVLMFLYCFRLTDEEVRPVFTPWSNWLWTILFGCLAALVLNTLYRFWMLWWGLRDLLRRLEYHPLRQAFSRLPDRLSWTLLWSLAALRPTMVSLQMTGDYLSALAQSFDASSIGFGPSEETLNAVQVRSQIDALMTKFHKEQFPLDPDCYRMMISLRYTILPICWSRIAALMEPWKLQRLEGWRTTKTKAADSKGENQTAGADSASAIEPKAGDGSHKLTPLQLMSEEFIALQYCAYIRYALIHLRNMLGFVGTGLTLLFIALSVYPFEPSGILANCASFLFSVATIIVVSVFYQMDKDTLLSRLSDTTPGKLDAGFGWRLFQFGALPAVTFLAIHFPPIGQALVKVVQIIPGLAR